MELTWNRAPTYTMSLFFQGEARAQVHQYRLALAILHFFILWGSQEILSINGPIDYKVSHLFHYARI